VRQVLGGLDSIFRARFKWVKKAAGVPSAFIAISIALDAKFRASTPYFFCQSGAALSYAVFLKV
jgi:hypothetical protein